MKLSCLTLLSVSTAPGGAFVVLPQNNQLGLTSSSIFAADEAGSKDIKKNQASMIISSVSFAVSLLLSGPASAVSNSVPYPYPLSTVPTVTVATQANNNDDVYSALMEKTTSAQLEKQVQVDKAAEEAFARTANELKTEAKKLEKEESIAIAEAKQAEKKAASSLEKALKDEIAAAKSGDAEAKILADAQVEKARQAAEAAEKVVMQDLTKEAKLKAAAARAEATADFAERKLVADKKMASAGKKIVNKIDTEKKLAMKQADKQAAAAKWTNPTGGKVLPKEGISASALAYIKSLN